jgi:hypothetical protein
MALVLGQTPAVGWREVFSRPRCDVAVCKCRDCAGGANCCCVRARTPLEQAIAQSQCDRAEQQQLALTVMPRMATTTPIALPAPIIAFLPYLPLRLSPLSRSYRSAQSAAPRLLQTGMTAACKHAACEGAHYQTLRWRGQPAHLKSHTV